MNLKRLFSTIKELQTVDDSVIIALYTLSTRALLVVVLLAILVIIALYPVLHGSILVWALSLMLLTGYRLYSAYMFKQNPKKYSMALWYKKFIFDAILTALVFSTLGFIFIHQVDPYYQLYIVAVLLGLSLGSTVSLSADARLNIMYSAILLLPLIYSMAFLYDTPLHIILTISLILYFLAQATNIYNMYKQKNAFNTLQSEHMLLNSLFKNAPLGIFTYDKDLKVLECNEQLKKLFEYETDEIRGMDLHLLPDRDIVKVLENAIIEGTESYEGPYVSLKNKSFWIDAKVFSFTDLDNNILGGVGMIEDKTKEHTALIDLEYMVQHDVLTGLLNRRGFRIYMENLVTSPKHQTYFSILFYLDLNQFKSINDSLGHQVGDDVLLAVSKRLTNLLGKDCMVSRLGGDEFIIIIPHVSEDKNMANQEAEEFSREIQDLFLEPFIIKEMHLHIKSSIGIVLMDPGYKDIVEIIRHADLSMYQAKIDNGHIAYYDSSLDKQQKELFILQHDLIYAVKNNQLGLFYQPVVSIDGNIVSSAEALVRWEHPTRGSLSPQDFIPLAMKAGLISQITWWVLDTICQHISHWKKENRWNLEYISMNVNAQQFVENDFAREFLKKLKEYGLETNDIMIEITERSLIDNFDYTEDVITELRRQGVRCAIDDFGTGYSSLSYLKKLSFHTLKIDKEFIKNIETSAKEVHLVSSILGIGRQFDYNIVIEGIENEQQQELLRELDPKLRYQGYHFCKAIDAEEFSERFLT
ncbi:EAL domain-containing protein [Sulfurovum sp. XTW-4]|uniref:EAL domain-containing protein n=1 Tax=Sulfurovum xiamenensis TaxID=3019066 RepID=A0ABT7QQ48_9BACT|nr:EAL domain-containing protein [Sulfurovum xiamenensis]MDM5263235.1 EAL domain-containing protein [Sulfurovum xiamenensis]